MAKQLKVKLSALACVYAAKITKMCCNICWSLLLY